MFLAQRVALVTGGSRGIGRAIALAMAAAGAKVAINYARSDRAAEEVAGQIRAGGGQTLTIRGDVSDGGQAEALVQRVLDEWGRLDILVNNAGIARDQLLVRLKEADWDAVLDTNLKGVFFCTKAVARAMMKQRFGRVINISSVVGLTGNAGQVSYTAAKAGVIGFTKSVARELASRNITVNAICPGLIETDMTAELTPEQRQAVLQQVPLGRPGRPEEVAALAVFLTGPGGDYITGQTLCVDGGMTMQ